jgi:hypothetical protein
MLTWSIVVVVGGLFFLVRLWVPPQGVNLGLNTHVYSGNSLYFVPNCLLQNGINTPWLCAGNRHDRGYSATSMEVRAHELDCKRSVRRNLDRACSRMSRILMLTLMFGLNQCPNSTDTSMGIDSPN